VRSGALSFGAASACGVEFVILELSIAGSDVAALIGRGERYSKGSVKILSNVSMSQVI
jgi:hypothetical protein